MKKVLPVVLLLSTFFCNAQNYQCLQSGVKHYFTNGNGYLRGIRIDSVKTFPDSTVYYPYHTPRGYYTSSAILDSNGGSWLGTRSVELNDGTFLFDNLWKDTVTIKTNAHLGDSWVFYNDTTSLFYRADLVSVDTMTVLGSIDSIKTILITARNPSGVVITDPVDSFRIILSKNNGFVRIFDLYTFPYHAPDSIYRPGLDYYLDYLLYPSGLAPTDVTSIFSLIQLVNPTKAELYQWNVGDVYEYSDCNEFFEHYGTVCNPVEHYYLDTITAVTATTTGVNYTYSGWASRYTAPWPVSPVTFPLGPFIYTTTRSGGVLNYDSTLLIDTVYMPEEYGHGAQYSYIPNDSSYCIVNTLYSILGAGPGYITGAMYIPMFEYFPGPTRYKSPLGLLYGFSAGAGTSGFLVQEQKLIYYERGGSPCGAIAIPPTAVNDMTAIGSSVTISPNPVQNELTITSPERITNVVINNLVGQTVYTHSFNSEQLQIDVADFPVGVYFIKINGTEVRKFIKQ
jgi:hypothetical protein